MATVSSDPEKGLMSATARPLSSVASSSPMNAGINTAPVHTPLELFQLLVGIHTPPSLTQSGTERGRDTSSRGRSDNIGLYQRAKDQERASRLAFVTTSFISNTLYLLQILLAATFTALSAYKKTNPVTLTVLGAINTVLAG